MARPGWPRASVVAVREPGLCRAAPLPDVLCQALRDGFVPRSEQARMRALEGRIEADLQLERQDGLVPELRESPA